MCHKEILPREERSLVRIPDGPDPHALEHVFQLRHAVVADHRLQYFDFQNEPKKIVILETCRNFS